ncbi:MAG: hypothetical protein AAFV25_06940 [Bacteroidota bacterium]
MTTKMFFALLLGCSMSFWAEAQTRAVTEKGDTIYVYNDGTWSYDELSLENSHELGFLGKDIDLDTISTPFLVSPTANKEIKSDLGFYSVKYDSKIWKRMPPGAFNEEAEMALKGSKTEIYFISIAEEIEVGTENLLKIALNNVRENTGGEVEVLKSEIRTVNGTELAHTVFKLKASGLNLIFAAYYFSNASGTVQLTAWTGSNLYDRYKDKMEELLNGFFLAETKS